VSKFSGKIAVITGATSGMALATAKLFVEETSHRSSTVSIPLDDIAAAHRSIATRGGLGKRVVTTN
jgi:NAD(P)-dependent dehydrogenase (short-subunit alcohol dehydrogenase family)